MSDNPDLGQFQLEVVDEENLVNTEDEVRPSDIYGCLY